MCCPLLPAPPYGALIHRPTDAPVQADVTVTVTRPQLLALLTAGNANGVTIDGDASVLTRLVALTDNPDPRFRHAVGALSSSIRGRSTVDSMVHSQMVMRRSRSLAMVGVSPCRTTS